MGSLIAPFKAPKTPKAPSLSDIAPPPAPSEHQVDAVTEDARDRSRRAAQLASGQRSTILTGPQGVTRPGLVGQKQLLGA